MNKKEIIQTIRVNPRAYEEIRRGDKTVDVRTNTHRYRHLDPGVMVNFYQHGSFLRMTIDKIVVYESLESLLEDIPFSLLNSEVSSDKETIEHYRSIGYTEEKVKKHGLLAIFVRLIE